MNTTESGQPLGLGLGEGLGPLPEPGDVIRAELPDEVAVRRVQLWAAELVAAERERCAKLCDLHSRLTWNDDRQAQSRVLAAEIRRGPNARVHAAP